MSCLVLHNVIIHHHTVIIVLDIISLYSSLAITSSAGWELCSVNCALLTPWLKIGVPVFLFPKFNQQKKIKTHEE